MPKLPSFREKVKIRTDVAADPTMSIEGATMVNKASSRMWDQVSRIGNQLTQQLAEAELTNKENDLKDALAKNEVEITNQLKQKYEGQDYKGYAEEKAALRSKFIEDYTSKEINPFTKNRYKNITDRFSTQTEGEDLNIENTTRARYYRGKLLDRRNSSANQQYLIPNEKNALQALRESRIDILKNKAVYEQEDHDYIKRNEHVYATGMLDGFIRDGKYDRAEKFLMSKNDPYKELRDTMNPDQVDKYMDEIKRKRKSAKSEKKSNAMGNLRLYEQAMKTKDTKNPDTKALTEKMFSEIASMADGEKKMEAFARAEAASIKASIRSGSTLFSKEEIDNIDAFAENHFKYLTSANPFLQAKTVEDVKKLAQDVFEEQSIAIDKGTAPDILTQGDDQAAEIAEGALNDPQMYGMWKAKMDSFYDNREVPYSKRTYTTNAMKSYYKGIETALSDRKEDRAVNMLATLENTFGEDAYANLTRMGLSPKLAAFGHMDNDPDTRIKMMKLFNDPTFKPQAKERLNMTSKDEDAVMRELEKSENYQAMLKMGGMTENTRRNADALKEWAYINYLDQRDRNTPHSNALKGSWNIFSNKKSYNQGRNSYVLPNNLGQSDYNAIERVMERTTSFDPRVDETVIDELNIETMYGAVKRGNDELRADLFRDIRATGSWSTSPDGKVLELRIRGGEGVQKVAEMDIDKAIELGKTKKFSEKSSTSWVDDVIARSIDAEAQRSVKIGRTAPMRKKNNKNIIPNDNVAGNE